MCKIGTVCENYRPVDLTTGFFMLNAREAAYLSLCRNFIDETLNRWKEEENPKQKDFNLAYEIAAGTCRRLLSLEYIAKHHVAALPRKKKERLLLYTLLYQLYYLDRIPLYAALSESVSIAKKHLSSHFAQFLNGAFRHFEKRAISFPNLSLQYSYPQFFIDRVSDPKILAAMNQVFPVQARQRITHEMVPVEDLSSAVKDTSLYIQNGTFVHLILHLANYLKKDPETVLDLAASPGGKLILVHDLFPKSKLFANDIDTAKLEENLQKYAISAHVTQGPAEEYPTGQQFDLILCDVPCSNSGVLGKRPEARWRLNAETLEQLQRQDLAILNRAKTLLKKGGQIWYMTCSILEEENGEVVLKSKMTPRASETCYPDEHGNDGGFGAVLT